MLRHISLSARSVAARRSTALRLSSLHCRGFCQTKEEPAAEEQRAFPMKFKVGRRKFLAEEGTKAMLDPEAYAQRDIDPKVWMSVSLEKLELEERQEEILREIVGPRYNVRKKLLRLNTDKFDTHAENQQHLIEMAMMIVEEVVKIDDERQRKAAQGGESDVRVN